MAEEKFHVTCSCGTTLAFRLEQAGGRFRCPKCKQHLDLTLPEEEEPPPPPRRAPGHAPAARPGSGRHLRLPAPPPPPPPRAGSGPARRSHAPPPPPEDEEEAPARPAGKSGLAARGRASQAQAPAPAASGGGSKKLLFIGGGAAVVLVIAVVLVLALGKKAKPETAGKIVEGKELWKKIAEDMRAADTKDDTGAREGALKRALEAVGTMRGEHDFGWPDFFEGRILHRQGKYDEANAALGKAIEKLDKSAQAYPKIERGLIAARRVHEALLLSRRFRAGGASAAKDPAVAALEQQALPDLKLHAGTKEADFFSGGFLALAEAEAERIEGRPSAAQNKLESAISAKADPGYAGALNGAIYYDVDKFEYGMKAMDAAVVAGGGGAFVRLSRAWGLRKRALSDPGNKDAPAWLEKAAEDADAAKKAGHPAGATAAACVRLDRVRVALDRGEDAKTLMDEAERATAEAAEAQEMQAAALLLRAEIDERAGRDVRASLDKAIGLLGGDDPLSVLTRARANLRRARAEGAGGGDPRPFYERAVRDYDGCAGLAGGAAGTAEPIVGAAVAKVEKALEDSRRGADSSAIFLRIVEDMTSLLKSRPGEAAALEARGLASWALGDALAREGKDGVTSIDKALDDLAELFRLRPSLRTGTVLVDAWLARADACIKINIDPRSGYDGAARVLEDLLTKYAPGSIPLLLKRGRAKSKSGEHMLTQAQGDARIPLAGAIDDYSQVLKAEPGNLDALYERGMALLNLSRAESKADTDARVSLNRAIADLELLVSKDASSYRAAYARADAILTMAWLDSGLNSRLGGSDIADTLTRAEAAFETAAGLDPKAGEAWNGLGCVSLLAGEALWKKDKDGAPEFAKAETSLRKALGMGYARAGINLGVALAHLKKWEEAAAAFEAALKACPESKKDIEDRQRWLAQLRNWEENK